MTGFTKETERKTIPKLKVAVAYTPNETVELLVRESDEWEHYYFITAIATLLETNEPDVKVIDDFQNAKMMIDEDYEKFWASHENNWKDVWVNGSISIHGNLRLAQAVNSSMYYIIR